MSKWPKQLPPLSPEQQRVSDDFMQHWLNVYARNFGWVDRFNHQYVVKQSAKGFRTTLEIGAGLGEHLAYERLTPEQEKNYTALDVRENMVLALQQRFPAIRVLHADCQQPLDFPDDSFDRVLAIHVLEHLPNLPAAARQLHRVCHKQHGRLHVVIPCEGSLATALAREISAKRIFQKRYQQPYDWFIQREHINRPKEIFHELSCFFVRRHWAFFPLPVPWFFCNLFVGATFTPRPTPALPHEN